MIIDAHAHVAYWEELGIAGSAENCIRLMDRYGIETSCISCSRALRGDFVRGNRETLAAIEQYPGRFLGYAVANPLYGDEAVAEIHTCIKDLGFIGCKFHVSHTLIPYAEVRYDPLFDAVRELDVPVLCHTFDGCEGLAACAARHPDVTLIAGHMGGYRWDEGCIAGARHPNIYLELCCSCSERGIVEGAVAAVGADRVLFGTDLGLLDPATTLLKVYDADISETDRRKILGGNMARLLKLEEAME